MNVHIYLAFVYSTIRLVPIGVFLSYLETVIQRQSDKNTSFRQSPVLTVRISGGPRFGSVILIDVNKLTPSGVLRGFGAVQDRRYRGRSLHFRTRPVGQLTRWMPSCCQSW